MLTAKGRESDKVIGSDLGADDYVTKPLACASSLHESMRSSGGGTRRDLQPMNCRINCNSAMWKLMFPHCAEHEMARPSSLHRASCRCFSFTENAATSSRGGPIFNEIWEHYYRNTRTLDQVIVKLRQKIEPEPSEPRHLLTVHGLGYRLDA